MDWREFVPWVGIPIFVAATTFGFGIDRCNDARIAETQRCVFLRSAAKELRSLHEALTERLIVLKAVEAVGQPVRPGEEQWLRERAAWAETEAARDTELAACNQGN